MKKKKGRAFSKLEALQLFIMPMSLGSNGTHSTHKGGWMVRF
jgi:hypothetical protein